MKAPGSQLRIVIFLLLAAVVLPTVCLLWFASQAVKNERLAVKQRLIDSYQKRANTFFVDYANGFWKGAFDQLASAGNMLRDWPAEIFVDMVTSHSQRYRGAVIYNTEGDLVWPAADLSAEVIDYDLLEKANRLEYKEQDFSNALAEYERAADKSADHKTGYTALFGKIRCLGKLDRTGEAIETAYNLAYPLLPEDADTDTQMGADILTARVLLARLYLENPDEQLYLHLRRCLTGARYNDEKVSGAIVAAADAKIWALQEFIYMAENCIFSGRLKQETAQARAKVKVLRVSLEVAEAYESYEKVLPFETISRLETTSKLYGFVTRNAGYNILMIISGEYMTDYFLAAAFNDFNDEMAYCGIYDDSDALLLGKNNTGSEPFMKVSLGLYMPGFSARLFFADGGVFETAASRQAALYTWSAVLIIVLILTAGTFAVGSVSRQVKLNRLKNDFLATVTHELKTPVASTRVLVDTLAERDIQPQRRREYLSLIAAENSRLSRLIDNFLTFSRMERNKLSAFDLSAQDPKQIALGAANAVRGHFDEKICNFSVTLPACLPSIKADADAMTTVLVNLLENAYKYGGEQKEIELKVYAEDGYVCFAVRDNGPGIPRRAHKKIFERFYQLDTSLSRQAEGTGLGLSIVKFIVDAHKGQIEVESKPGKGSEFTVRINKLS